MRPTQLHRSAAFVVAAILLSATRSEAEKVGYVDVKAVATRSSSIQGAVKGAEEKLRVKQEELEIQIRDYRGAQKELEARKSVLTEDEAKKQKQKIEGMRDAIDASQSQIDKELRKTENDVMGPAVERIIAAVQKLGKEQGYDLILTQDIIIYGSPALDLTPQVVRMLDSTPAQSSEESSVAAPESKTETPKTETKKTETKKGDSKKKK